MHPTILILTQVVRMLGTPEEMRKVLVHPVGQAGLPVNVVVGKDVSTSRIADSFFLTADEDGNILSSPPKIDRLYRSGRIPSRTSRAMEEYRDLLEMPLVRESGRTAGEVDALTEEHSDIVGHGVSGGRVALDDTAGAIIAEEYGQS